MGVGRYIDFHHVSNDGSDYKARLHTDGSTDGQLFINGNKIWNTNNLTNLNQLTNGPGYITSSGSISGNAATASRVANTGISSSWLSGRDNAIVKQTTVNGYSVVMSTKTNNGSWELGNYTSFGDQFLLSYFSDSNYNAGTN